MKKSPDLLHQFAVVSLRQIRFSANGGELNILFRSQTVFDRSFPQPFWELLLSFAVAFIPIAIVVWDHQTATTAELEAQAPRRSGA